MTQGKRRFNVIGFLSGNLGLGVFARSVVRLLQDLSMEVHAVDLDPGFGRGGRDYGPASALPGSHDSLREGINLFVLAAPELRRALLDLQGPLLEGQALNVALPMWELPVFPQGWTRVFDACDVLAAATPFIRCALESGVRSTPVIDAPIPLSFPIDAIANRNRFSLPPEKTLFFSAFEPKSDPHRKNVESAIRAFVAADPDAEMVVKVNNAYEDGREHPSLARLRKMATPPERFHFLTEELKLEDLAVLYASVDVFVSLHRAEGLGLMPMEAMALGRPVIATGWSGNMAFMNHLNACLVGYRLVPVSETGGRYASLMHGTPALWAEPDVSNAADWIRELAAARSTRARFGDAGRVAIAKYNASASQGSFVQELIAMADSPTFLRKTREHKRRAIDALARISTRPPLAGRIRYRIDEVVRRLRVGA